MSRSTITIIIGGALGLAVGIFIAGALLFGGRLFSSRTAVEPTPAIVQLETPVGPTATAEQTETVNPTGTATVTVEGSGTAVATTAVPTNNGNGGQPSATATPIVVSNTAVQFVQAQVDVNIRSGPGTGYDVVGWIADGQTAKVTGVNEATGWWRVICPDDTVGSCWVTGNSQFTLPTNGPVVVATPTIPPTPTACTDSAVLVADITVPDNTEYAPNVGFNKVWRLKNTGTCTWNANYQVVHYSGPTMGAITTAFPLNQSVAPGQTVDISISMVSPASAGTYMSHWKLKNVAGKQFGVGASNNPFYVRIVVTDPNIPSTISGVVFQDWNENGVYDSGDTPMGSREVVLIPSTSCHVYQPPAAVVHSGADGVYTFKGNYSGNFCVGLNTGEGLEDVRAVTVAPGQVITNLNLRAFAPLGSISGYVWSDYCALSGSGNTWEGNCVSDGLGSYRADGMIQPTEVNISGVTVILRAGSCLNYNNSVPVAAVTDGTGRYTFGGLSAGTYCITIDPTSAENAHLLLPGWFTFPSYNGFYHEITLTQGANAYSVNFGWDYQFN